jgi:histidinol-phosphate phosphatase family protein
MLIIMHGLTASGKSTYAKRVAKNLGADLFHTAIIRKELSLDTGFSFLLDDRKFTEVISPKVYSEMIRRARFSLNMGKDVILDGSFCLRWEREMAYSLARETQQEMVILDCICDELEEIKRRLEERRKSNDPLSEAKDINTYYSLKEKSDPIAEEELEDVSLVQVDTLWWRMRWIGLKPPTRLLQALDLDKAIFLDRDGTINKEPELYVLRPEELSIIEGTAEALRTLRKNVFKIIIITNQAGIGNGILTEEMLSKIHEKMMLELKKKGAYIDKIYYCPHRKEVKCECRKPSPGLIRMAISDFGLNPGKCWLIGNKETDIIAGLSSGIKSILVETNKGIKEATDYILERNKVSQTSIRVFYP